MVLMHAVQDELVTSTLIFVRFGGRLLTVVTIVKYEIRRETGWVSVSGILVFFSRRVNRTGYVNSSRFGTAP